MSKQTKFHGILAVGRTKASAVNNYRLLAMGKGAAVQVDGEREIAFVTHASSADGMFNPMSGNMDLETDEALCSKLEFQSESSGDVEVNHLVCQSGCGAHVVFDSESLVKYCPNCTSSLSDASEDGEDLDGEDDGDEDGDDFEADASDDEDDCEVGDDGGDDLGEEEDDEMDDDEELLSQSGDFDEESDSAEDDEDAGEEEDAGDDESSEDEDAGDEEGSDEESEDAGDDEEAGDEEGSDEGKAAPKKAAAPVEEEPELPPLDEDDGEVVIAAESLSEATRLLRENLPQTSLSSGNIDAHYMRCTSGDCGAHVVSTSEVAECPACHSSVEEPEDSEEEDVDGDEDEDEDNTLSLTDEDSGNILDEDSEDIDAGSDLDEESDSADLDVSYSSSVAGKAVWTAFYKGLPVAMASKSTAGKNEDIFDTPRFGQAVLATAKVAGIKKSLSELGFQPIKHKVSVSREVRRMVESEVSAQRASISADQEAFKEQFMAALATAAIGINRGFFTDVSNPIKSSLWNSMNSAGIRSPEALIDATFKNHSDAYHKALFAQASDIVAKPKEVQESLAKAVLGTTYQAISSGAAEETLEGRLETMGTSTSSANQPAPAAPIAGEVQKRAVQSLGRRFR